MARSKLFDAKVLKKIAWLVVDWDEVLLTDSDATGCEATFSFLLFTAEFASAAIFNFRPFVVDSAVIAVFCFFLSAAAVNVLQVPMTLSGLGFDTDLLLYLPTPDVDGVPGLFLDDADPFVFKAGGVQLLLWPAFDKDEALLPDSDANAVAELFLDDADPFVFKAGEGELLLWPSFDRDRVLLMG